MSADCRFCLAVRPVADRPIAAIHTAASDVCCAAVAAAHDRWSNYRSPLRSSHSGRQDSRFSNDCFQVRSSPLLTGCLRGAGSPLYRLANRCRRPIAAVRIAPKAAIGLGLSQWGTEACAAAIRALASSKLSPSHTSMRLPCAAVFVTLAVRLEHR